MKQANATGRTNWDVVEAALRSWLAQNDAQDARDPKEVRLLELGKRITLALDLASQSETHTRKFSPAHVAKGIGEPQSLSMYDWLAGLSEPTFRQMDLIADWCGVDAEWLSCGEGSPYPRLQGLSIDSPMKGALYILGLEAEADKLSGQGLRLFCSKEKGRLIAARKRGYHYDIIPIHSRMANAGRDNSIDGISKVCVILNLLYLAQNPQIAKPTDYHIYGFLIGKEECEGLAHGFVNPNSLCKANHTSHWWADIWDSSSPGYTDPDQYWKGCKELVGAVDQHLRDRYPEFRRMVREVADKRLPEWRSYV